MTTPSVTNSASAGYNSATTTADATLTVSSGSSRVLIAWALAVDVAQTYDFSSVTFDPGGGDEASFTHESPADSINDYGHRVRSAVWYLILDDGVSSGDYTVRIVADESISRITGIVWEMADADTTDPIGGVGTGSGNTDTLSVPVTTTASNSLVAMGGLMEEEVNFTEGSGDTEVVDVNQNNSSHWSGYTPAATTGEYTVSAQSSDTPNNDYWVASAVEILEAAAAADVRVPQLIQPVQRPHFPLSAM